MAHKPEELQEVLHYTFKNPALLRIALTHTSYANESKVATTHNERLEFLGDSVLSVVVADYLFHQSGRPEGELTRMRASLVSEDALFQFAQEIQLGEYLRLGHGQSFKYQYRYCRASDIGLCDRGMCRRSASDHRPQISVEKYSIGIGEYDYAGKYHCSFCAQLLDFDVGEIYLRFTPRCLFRCRFYRC